MGRVERLAVGRRQVVAPRLPDAVREDDDHEADLPAGGDLVLGAELRQFEVAEVVQRAEEVVHLVLAELDDLGYFELPQFGAEDEIPAGGEVSFVVVTLADGVWEARRDNLSATDGATLDAAHAAIREAIGLEGDG